jgi:threonine dehydrogenase-like Zn-dependent dehydrogenase
LTPLILATHRFRIEEAQEALEIASAYKDGILKVLVSFD